MKVGLRIDVDTFRGTRLGVPNLCEALGEQDILASFFFSVGPDNMGRHLRRLVRPDFLMKMFRTRAGSLYGWDILMRGTLWPGPVIGEKLGHVIRAAADAGHEAGFHAWDHHAWQAGADMATREAIQRSLEQGVALLTRILGHPPSCSAAAGWRADGNVLEEKLRFPFRYNSDCRGRTIFYPVVGRIDIAQPQVPVTLPTYDEVIGNDGISDDSYNEHILSLLDPNKLNVLCIHAEVEGIVRLPLFRDFLRKARANGCRFVALGQLLDSCEAPERAALLPGKIQGREGWVACQAQASRRQLAGEGETGSSYSTASPPV